jgi:hypothetical protein
MILTTLDQFKTAIPTAVSLENFSDVETFLRDAELWIKNNVLGRDLYDSIVSSAESSTEDVDNDLLLLCQSVIANHAYWDAIPFLDLTHSNSGFAVIQSNNQVPASKERVERLREQCLIRRDSQVETLIGYLEDHSDYHDLWKGSPVYSIMTDCLIRTARELEQYGQWTGNRRDFLQLRPKLIQETMMRLEPVFSQSYIDELIEKQRDGDLTADDTKVLTLLKYVLGGLVNGNMEAAQKIAADALRYIDAAIIADPLRYATYQASQEYTARTTAGYENELESTIFSSLF